MLIEVKVPQLSESVAEASLVAWHKKTGDQVEAGEVIGVMEAMKMETALHAPQAGTLQCLAAAGEMLTAGQVVARVQ